MGARTRLAPAGPLGPRVRLPGRLGLRRRRLLAAPGGGLVRSLHGDPVQLRGLRPRERDVVSLRRPARRARRRARRHPWWPIPRGRRWLRRRLWPCGDAAHCGALRRRHPALGPPQHAALHAAHHCGRRRPRRPPDPHHRRGAVADLRGGLPRPEAAGDCRPATGVANGRPAVREAARHRHLRGPHGLPGCGHRPPRAGQAFPSVQPTMRGCGRRREWRRNRRRGRGCPHQAIQQRARVRRP
mmetsp:Transcript_18357/g.52030  ORF Transcript_18357/g.52030 Transcript_18357/m.52030 type:complete len:242 (+) Transcript_18357:481-1206(+)